MYRELDAAKAFHTWLVDEGLDVVVAADGEVLEVTIPDSGGRKLRIIAVPDTGFLLMSMVSFRVPRERWTVLYPLLSQINTQLPLGSWILDPETEQLVFRLGLVAEGVAYEPAGLRSAMSFVATAVSAMESEFAMLRGDGILAGWQAEDAEE